MKMDWSLGHYEHTAAQLHPAAEVAVEYAAPEPGERLVDVGCGTGNAALIAAGRGARVSGVDPAPRLLEVARRQAAGVDATFVEGEASALPLDDSSADVLLSVFGVIFAPDAAAAAAEMARVASPSGRMVLTAWIPQGAISEVARASREAVALALGGPAGPPPFAWHEADALGGLLAPYGFELELSEHELAFSAASVDDYIAGEFDNHPLWLAGRALLDPRGETEALRERAREILTAANEDPGGFRVTSRYVVALAQRSSRP